MTTSRVCASGPDGSWRGAIGDSTHRKVTRRLLPILIIFYILAYIGRSNLGYAALTMNTDLGVSDAAFGLVVGIFFIAYFIFEVPSNILLDRFGARKWIARILVTWGIVIVCTGFVQNLEQLYIARFLLSAAAKAISVFMLAIPISYMIGAPISGWVIDHVHWLDMPSWRWIFILEGIPSIIAALVVLAAGVLAKSVRNDQLRQQEDLAQAEVARQSTVSGSAEGAHG